MAFTYNDPVIFAEYAIDTADACHALGLKTVAVTAGYMHAEARREFFAKMDAANVDLKAFTDDFYFKLTGGHLQPVLDTLVYLEARDERVARDHHPADPRPQRLRRRTRGDVRSGSCANSAPTCRCTSPPSIPTTRCSTCRQPRRDAHARARDIALEAGLRYVYTGNVHDTTGGTTSCPGCPKP